MAARALITLLQCGCLGTALVFTMTGLAQADEWARLTRFKAENAAQLAIGRPNIVFLGDSITENWAISDPSFFSKTTVQRGIAGQTSSQILLRFYQDVIALHPKFVHIMAGTNDVAGNGGAVSDDDIMNNFRAMLDLASTNGIKVIVASIPPMAQVPGRPDIQGTGDRIVMLNAKLHQLAIDRGAIYVDYHSILTDAHNGLQSRFGNDGVHPNADGYALMRPLAENAIYHSLAKP